MRKRLQFVVCVQLSRTNLNTSWTTFRNGQRVFNEFDHARHPRHAKNEKTSAIRYVCAALSDQLKIRHGPRSWTAKSASPTNSFNEFLSNEGEKSTNENTANTRPKYQLRRRTRQISPFYHLTTSIIRQRSIIWSFDNDMTSPSTSPVLYSFNVCTKK